MRKLFYAITEQFEKEQERWFLWLPVFFACGIGFFFSLPEDFSIWRTLGVIEFLIVLTVVFRRHIRILAVLMLIAMVVLGFADIQLKSVYLAKRHVDVAEGKTYVSGRIDKLDYNYKGTRRAVIEDARNFEEENLGALKLSTRERGDILYTGQCVEMAAQVFPLAKAAIVGGFQFDRKAFFEGVDGSGYALSAVLPDDCSEKVSFSDKFRILISNLREKIVKRIKAVLPADEASVAAAIIAGEQGGIKADLIDGYRNSGLAHFLSISGLHMTMLAGLMFFLVRLVMALVPSLAVRYDSKKPAAVFAILLSVFYLLISGAHLPAQRAFIMNFVIVLGVLFNRRAISMKTVSFAAFLILIFEPQSLISVSFQMSFAAVIALVAFYERYAGGVQRFLKGRDGRESSLPVRTIKILWVYMAGILVSDLVASLATLPFAIYHFNKIAIYTSLANMAAGPIIGFVIMPFVLIALLLMPFGLDVWALKLVGLGISYVNQITTWVSSLPHAAYPVLSMPSWGLTLIVLGGLWLCIWQQKWRWFGLLGIVLGFVSIATVRVPDVIVSQDTKLVAVKDNNGNMVVLPARGMAFTKKLWQDKTASQSLSDEQENLLKEIYKGKVQDKKWLDLKCDRLVCIYKNRVKILKGRKIVIDHKAVDAEVLCGANIYLDEKPRIESVREYIGNRLWNKNN